ncbi:MAG: amino acid ABC transporter substrate-binding protein [Thermomicrobiaceae bacterium]|nr:amino acid ABC transporter substrate-binding protein [Thermomicrobiaceae bacterium]
MVARASRGPLDRVVSRREFLRVTGAGLGGVVLLAGCGGSSGGSSGDTVTFGAAVSLTGDTAKEGKLTQDGYKFYEQWVNAHGGLKVGNKTYKVALKLYDDQSDPNQSARLYQKLITEDKITHLLGPYGTNPTMQVAVITEKYKIPQVEGNGASTQIFSKGYKYTFGVLTPAPQYLHSVIDVALTQNPPPKTVAIVSDNDSFSVEVAQGAKDYGTQKGLNVVALEQIPANSTDVSAVLTRIKGLNPDILLGSGHFNTSVLIMKTARSLGLNAKMYGFSVGPSVPDFLNSLGEAANYVFGGTQWTADLKYQDELFGTAKDYAENFKKAFNYDPDYHVAESTAACYALHLAIQAAKSLDPQKVRDALASLDAMTFYGRIKFDETGKNIYKPMAAEQWQNGKKVTVWPAEAATAKALYPAPPWNERAG